MMTIKVSCVHRAWQVQSFIIMLCLCSLNNAQVRGRIVDGCGHPLAGATIFTVATLLKTTTDMDGNFDLGNVRAQSQAGGMESFCRFSGNKIVLNLKEPALFTMETFNLLGAKIGTGCKQRLLKGSYKFNVLQEGIVSSSVYIVKIKIGRTAICTPIISGTKRNFSGSSLVFTGSKRNQPMVKVAAALNDTLIASLDGYETKRVPLDSSASLDTVALNSYSYTTQIYNGSYQVGNGSLTIIKRQLDTIQSYCGNYCDSTGACVDSTGAPLGGIVLKHDIFSAETLTIRYSLIDDTLRFFMQTDTCRCIDTMHYCVDHFRSFARIAPGTGVEGSWGHPRFSCQVMCGTIDSITKVIIDANDSNENTDWKMNNVMIIFDHGNYYERAFSKLTFAEWLLKDWQTCRSNGVNCLNTNLEIDSCEHDISIVPINANTVCLHGNKSGDSVIVSRLSNNDLLLTSPLSGNIPAVIKANPEVCPNTIAWFIDFKIRNLAVSYLPKKRVINAHLVNRNRIIW